MVMLSLSLGKLGFLLKLKYSVIWALPYYIISRVPMLYHVVACALHTCVQLHMVRAELRKGLCQLSLWPVSDSLTGQCAPFSAEQIP